MINSQAKRCLRTCAKCNDPDSFCACAKSHPDICSPLIHYLVPVILLADSEGPDQTARKHMLIQAFAARICSKTSFCMVRPNFRLLKALYSTISVNPCPAEYIKMPRPISIFCQSDYLI